MSQTASERLDQRSGGISPDASAARPAAGDADSEAEVESIRAVQPVRISTAAAPPCRDACDVVVETPLTIMIDGVGSFAVMCTPCDVEALAVGFAFSEGIISSADDIVGLACTRDPLVVSMRLKDPSQVMTRQNLIVTSSCGLCGQRIVDKLLAGTVACPDSLRVSGQRLVALTREMRERQELFRRTGGTHAAGIFSARGRLHAFAEDIGRHNALDKAIAKCLLTEQPLRGCGAVLSGRVSLELVAKAARAGLELIAAVSAPSSMALDVAQQCNITLCGFVREARATVYTHPHRIIDLEA